MPDETKAKRAYNSTRRKQQASETRNHIVMSARKLFIERGYTATTLDSIAQAAGVSVESLYAIFGNKKAILGQVVHMAVVGDAEPGGILEREGPQAVRAETNQRKQVLMFAHDMCEIIARVSPIFHLMRIASETEPDIAALLQNMLKERLAGIAAFVAWLASNGPLRGGMTVDAGADVAWTITSPEVHRLLTVDRGWSHEQYEQWIMRNLAILLLDEP